MFGFRGTGYRPGEKQTFYERHDWVLINKIKCKSLKKQRQFLFFFQLDALIGALFIFYSKSWVLEIKAPITFITTVTTMKANLPMTPATLNLLKRRSIQLSPRRVRTRSTVPKTRSLEAETERRMPRRTRSVANQLKILN